MSRKSRRHGRHLSRSQRRKLRFKKGFAQAQPAAPTQPVAVSQAQEPAPRTEAVAPPVRAPAPRPTATPVQLPHITAELKMIGILSGIMLVILIALAFILP
jgi:hypothetical protein